MRSSLEIIEIGAIKLNKERHGQRSNELIKPQVQLHEMNKITKETDPYSDAGAERGDHSRRSEEILSDGATGGSIRLYLGHAGSDGVTAEYGIL